MNPKKYSWTIENINIKLKKKIKNMLREYNSYIKYCKLFDQ